MPTLKSPTAHESINPVRLQTHFPSPNRPFILSRQPPARRGVVPLRRSGEWGYQRRAGKSERH